MHCTALRVQRLVGRTVGGLRMVGRTNVPHFYAPHEILGLAQARPNYLSLLECKFYKRVDHLPTSAFDVARQRATKINDWGLIHGVWAHAC